MDHIQLLNLLVETNSYKSYLEIGCAYDECFNRIVAPNKTGVDPVRGGTIRATSDDFFSTNTSTFDLIFIDGLHHYEQVIKDFENARKCLNPGGTIVLHDCNPSCKEEQEREKVVSAWTGDVWIAVLYIRGIEDVDIAVGDFDHGCGIVKMRRNTNPVEQFDPVLLSWGEFYPQKSVLLRLIDEAEVRNHWIR
jgi:SAM-dependent methyltransferase